MFVLETNLHQIKFSLLRKKGVVLKIGAGSNEISVNPKERSRVNVEDGVPLDVFQITFYTFCNIGPSIVVLKNDFILLWASRILFSLMFHFTFSIVVSVNHQQSSSTTNSCASSNFFNRLEGSLFFYIKTLTFVAFKPTFTIF